MMLIWPQISLIWRQMYLVWRQMYLIWRQMYLICPGDHVRQPATGNQLLNTR